MYAFHLDNKPYSKNRRIVYSCDTSPDMYDRSKPNSTRKKLKDLFLKKNQKFLFIFDFGDDHFFGIKVIGFGEAISGEKYPLIIEEKGKAPKQYGRY